MSFCFCPIFKHYLPNAVVKLRKRKGFKFCFSLISLNTLYQNIHFTKTHKADLDVDKLLSGKYIMLDRVDVHCVWVSQAVLNLLPDPVPVVPGGEIITDPGMGVFCDNAMDLVMRRWPRPGKEKKIEFVTSAIRRLHEVGLVGIHDAGVTPTNLDIFQEMADGEAWSMRVYAMFECERRNTFCPEDAVQYLSNDGMLQVQSVKLFAGPLSFHHSSDTESS